MTKFFNLPKEIESFIEKHRHLIDQDHHILETLKGWQADAAILVKTWRAAKSRAEKAERLNQEQLQGKLPLAREHLSWCPSCRDYTQQTCTQCEVHRTPEEWTP